MRLAPGIFYIFTVLLGCAASKIGFPKDIVIGPAVSIPSYKRQTSRQEIIDRLSRRKLGPRAPVASPFPPTCVDSVTGSTNGVQGSFRYGVVQNANADTANPAVSLRTQT